MQSSVRRTSRSERPVLGFVLSLNGGLFLAGAAILGPWAYWELGSAYVVYLVIQLVAAAGVLLAAGLLFYAPRYHVGWGVMSVVFGVTSIFPLGGTFGGFFVGMVLAILGGSFAIGWSPSGRPTFEDFRTCLACGRHFRIEFAHCPYCGARVAVRPVEPTPPRT